MRLAFYTVCISPHQLPLARELVKRLGVENFLYICYQPLSEDRRQLGWSNADDSAWILQAGEDLAKRDDWLEYADILFTYIRDFDLMERRSQAGLRTIYCCERWFKPFGLQLGLCCRMNFSGYLRLLLPSYRNLVRRVRKLAITYSCFSIYPMGIPAWKDFVAIGIPESKMTTWGYFVAPSQILCCEEQVIQHQARPLKILWVGRMIGWKRVDTIICAVMRAAANGIPITCTLVGRGPYRSKLEKLARQKASLFVFRDSLPIEKIRSAMQQHDVYVLSSDGGEGWGAALSEALEEGMICLGTNEAGASATILPPECRFTAGDDRRLAILLEKAAAGQIPRVPIGDWSAARAAERLCVKEKLLGSAIEGFYEKK